MNRKEQRILLEHASSRAIFRQVARFRENPGRPVPRVHSVASTHPHLVCVGRRDLPERLGLDDYLPATQSSWGGGGGTSPGPGGSSAGPGSVGWSGRPAGTSSGVPGSGRSSGGRHSAYRHAERAADPTGSDIGTVFIYESSLPHLTVTDTDPRHVAKEMIEVNIGRQRPAHALSHA